MHKHGRIDPRLVDPTALGPVLFLGNVPFRTMWQRAHRLAVGLAGSAPVTFVDPNRSFLQAVRRPTASDPPAAVPAGLTVVRPPAGLPAGRSSGLLNRLNYARCRRRLRAAESAGGRPEAVVVTFPDQADLLTHYPDVPVVYDLMDDPRLFVRPHQQQRYADLHAELLARADVVVVSARVLMDRCRPAARRVVWVSNGVADGLADAVRLAVPDPVVAHLPRPVFGYLGMISSWMDYQAVRAIALAHPQGTVALVGPVDVRPPDLPRNVVFTGPVGGPRLPGVLAGFDVGLIPFVRSQAIDAVNPLKLYEYLAAGLPVLSAGFEEIRQYRPLVRTYDTPAEAADSAADLAVPATPREAAARREFAAAHRWGAKVGQLASVLREVTNRPADRSNELPAVPAAAPWELRCAS